MVSPLRSSSDLGDMKTTFSLLLSLLVISCSDSTPVLTPLDSDVPDGSDSGPGFDGGPDFDGGPGSDGGPGTDGGPVPVDGGPDFDVGPGTDAGPVPVDAGPPSPPGTSLALSANFPIFGIARVGDGHLVVGRDNPGDRTPARQGLAAYFGGDGTFWANHYGENNDNEQFLALASEGPGNAVATGIVRIATTDSVLFARFAADGLVESRSYNVGSDAIGFDIRTVSDGVVVAGRVDNRPAVFTTDSSFGSLQAARIRADGQFYNAWASDTTIVAVGHSSDDFGNVAHVAVFDRATLDLSFYRGITDPAIAHRLWAVSFDGTTITAVGSRTERMAVGTELKTGLRVRMPISGASPTFENMEGVASFLQVTIDTGAEVYAGELTGGSDVFVGEGSASELDIVAIRGTRPGGFVGRPALEGFPGALMARTADDTIVVSPFDSLAAFGASGCNLATTLGWTNIAPPTVTTPAMAPLSPPVIRETTRALTVRAETAADSFLCE